jgi:hypothetical protein
MPCLVTPPLGARAQAYAGEYSTPTLRLAMWHAWADTRGLRPPSVRPNHHAPPWRRRAPWDLPPPWGEGFGIPNRSPDPLVHEREEKLLGTILDVPCNFFPQTREFHKHVQLPLRF